MSKIRVGILRGGVGYGYDASIKTGARILNLLPRDTYVTEDIFVAPDGQWHMDGVPVTLEDVARRVDVLFNCLYGESGENGRLQKDCDRFAIPYTGAGALASAFAMNKPLAKDIVGKEGIKTPRFVHINMNDDIGLKAQELFRTLSFPLMVKPARMGFSFGATIANSYEELVKAIHRSLTISDSVLVEEYIKGKEATCIMIDGFRSEDSYGLPVVEVKTPEGNIIFDEELKRERGAEFVCPAFLSKEEKEEVYEAAKKIHKILGLRHYSQSDFIVTPKGVYFLEANTVPDFDEGSILEHALESVGSNILEFLDHAISLAMGRK